MIIRPISKSISRGIGLAINDPSGAGFDPLSLFAAGEQGVWFDPSDLSTLFQDAAGTIPVTAAGQPVGMMRDKSGRGNHATQATATSRPILQTNNGKWYLAFDGVDDWMATASINLTTTDKMALWAGVKKLSDTVVGVICEFSSNINSFAGTFVATAPDATGAASDFKFKCRGSISLPVATSGPILAPATRVITGIGDISGDRSTLRLNGVQVADSTVDQGTGNLGNFPLFIGRRGGASLPFTGHIYGVIVRGTAPTAQQITNAETYMNSKTGAY